MSLFEICVIAQALLSLWCLWICLKTRHRLETARVVITCLYYWIWDNTGMSEDEIIREARSAGAKHGLPVFAADEAFEEEEPKWKC